MAPGKMQTKQLPASYKKLFGSLTSLIMTTSTQNNGS